MSHPTTRIQISPAVMQNLMQKQDRAGILHIMAHLSSIALAIFLLSASDHFLSQLLWMTVLGILMSFLFAPLHESIHKTAFKTQIYNEITSWICGFILVLPSQYFQSFHMAHHRYTQIADKDPELDFDKPDSFISYLLHLSGWQYWVGQLSAIARLAAGSYQAHFIHPKKLPATVKEARIYLGLYILLIIGSIWLESAFLLKYWVFPMLLGQPFLRAFLLAEHSLCPKVSSMLENTRTTLTNGLIRRLCWNMCYHVEHHAYPAIPFHELSDTHPLLRQHIQFLDHGYLDVNRQILRVLGSPSGKL